MEATALTTVTLPLPAGTPKKYGWATIRLPRPGVEAKIIEVALSESSATRRAEYLSRTWPAARFVSAAIRNRKVEVLV